MFVNVFSDNFLDGNFFVDKDRLFHHAIHVYDFLLGHYLVNIYGDLLFHHNFSNSFHAYRHFLFYHSFNHNLLHDGSVYVYLHLFDAHGFDWHFFDNFYHLDLIHRHLNNFFYRDFDFFPNNFFNWHWYLSHHDLLHVNRHLTLNNLLNNSFDFKRHGHLPYHHFVIRHWHFMRDDPIHVDFSDDRLLDHHVRDNFHGKRHFFHEHFFDGHLHVPIYVAHSLNKFGNFFFDDFCYLDWHLVWHHAYVGLVDFAESVINDSFELCLHPAELLRKFTLLL
mmetsp:Transcript_82432/g.133697  ORF Transcript_82432/g.133697 Transcript_82432/m.133697 type:complete len:278 (-) Transcript_82432:436-1269(-)